MRLFIAVKFSDKMTEALNSAAEELRRQGLSGNFTRIENLHLTLAFIGESTKVRDLAEVISESVKGLEPFEITLGGCGNFGQLYWAGLKKSRELEALVNGIRKRLSLKGFEVDSRPFKPHVTLVRQFVSEEKPSFAVKETSMTVDRVYLMKSERIGGKLIYSEVFSRVFEKC